MEKITKADGMSRTSFAVRVIYFDGQKKQASVSSFKTLVSAGKALGLGDDEAKVAALSIFDYATKHLQARLLAVNAVTQDQIDRSRF